jgi:hypothetical protein
VLLATVLTVAFGAWPVVESAIEGPRAHTARRGLERSLRARGWAAGPPEPTEHRVFGPSHLRPERRPAPELFEQLFDDSTLEGRTVRARGRIALLKNADVTAEPEITVDDGMALHVVKDAGAWLLLMVHDGGVHLGWVPRESIVTLP